MAAARPARDRLRCSASSGPSHLAHMRGAPELIGRSAAAQAPDPARRLWDASERLTGVSSRLQPVT